MTVRQLLASLDARELAEWQAFFKLEAENQKRAALDARARTGVNQLRKGR